MTTTFAYCRVSTLDQDTGIQETEIKSRYPNAVIRTEKKSGTTVEGREVLNLLLDMIHTGDKLVVWKLDRLARNMHDLTRIVALLEAKGASLEILDQAIDTGTAAGKAFLQMLGVFAEFETNLRSERQLVGIAAAKEKGLYNGRPVDTERNAKITELLAKGVKPSHIAKQLDCSRDTVYRVKKAS